MAHNLSIRQDGTVEFAFTGDRNRVWHGLGQQVEDYEVDDLTCWMDKAGMDWTAETSPVEFATPVGMATSSDHKVIYRSDSQDVLGVVGSKYNVVQPQEILGFFSDLIHLHDMKLSTAGCLFGGKRFFALAEMGKDFKLNGYDEIEGHLLLVTSLDGSLATTAKFVSTRVVCNNTLTIAMGESKGSLVKTSHRSEFDAKQVKIDLGLLDAGWETFKQNVTELSQKQMSAGQVREFFQSVIFNPTAEKQSSQALSRVEELVDCYATGDGAQWAYGSAWGALNAITNKFTHGFESGRQRQVGNQILSSMMGEAETIKRKAFADLLLAA